MKYGGPGPGRRGVEVELLSAWNESKEEEKEWGERFQRGPA